VSREVCFENILSRLGLMNSNPKVAITGAGSGLGAAMARCFNAAGYDVAVTDIDKDRADTVLAELQGDGSFSHVLDTTSESDWAQFHQHVTDHWGGVDVLINNAGVAAAGCCEETSMKDWQWVVDIDLMGVVRGCHQFIPLLRKQAEDGRKGYIVNIASFAGFSAMPGLCAYGTAKAAVIAFSEHLHTELADVGVGVSVVCPAFVRTNLMDDFRTDDPAQRDMVLRWMDNSGVTAEDVASAVIRAMQQRQFLLLTHKSTRWAHRLKRWWPERFYRQVITRGGQLRKKAK
jgi:NADP-dependent 3-hydroxy acid dehydrogenase YdfG